MWSIDQSLVRVRMTAMSVITMAIVVVEVILKYHTRRWRSTSTSHKCFPSTIAISDDVSMPRFEFSWMTWFRGETLHIAAEEGEEHSDGKWEVGAALESNCVLSRGVWVTLCAMRLLLIVAAMGLGLRGVG
jgi:hypothetical protein